MKKVVLFKSQSEEYKEAFGERQYDAVFVEPLQFEAVNAAKLSTLLLQHEHSGLVLTSPRAVDAAAACWDPARFILWNTKRIYTVGESTARKIKASLGLDAHGSSSGNAENLAKLIAQENPKGSSLLFPCGNLRSETLPTILGEAQISVNALTVYETKENVNLRQDLIELDALHKPCCLVFFSPSGCEYIHRQLQTFRNNLSQLPRFAIGNSTAHKIENLGLEIAGVATKPTPDCLVESVQKYFVQYQAV